MGEGPSQSELEAAHCWEEADRVPGRPEMTAYRRQVRLHQARWREANGHPIGTQPIGPRPDGPAPRLVGSRLPLDYAQETGATFLTANARSAATARLASKEAHQSLDRQRLWAELLWSLPMACNLFGDLAADLDLADRAVHTWWPDVPGTVCGVRFSYSPGRLDPAYPFAPRRSHQGRPDHGPHLHPSLEGLPALQAPQARSARPGRPQAPRRSPAPRPASAGPSPRPRRPGHSPGVAADSPHPALETTLETGFPSTQTN